MRGFQIKLDNYFLSGYNAGQTVCGRVILSSNKEKKLTGIKLRCSGTAGVSLSPLNFGNRKGQSSDLKYGSKEHYFNYEKYIFGKQNGPSKTLEPGYRAFPFSFRLPNGLPSSFEGTYGSIEYIIEARIKREWKTDCRIAKSFLVKGDVDLNFTPRATDVLKTYSEKNNVHCCCFSNGYVGFRLYMYRNGFIPGELLTFRASLYNLSSIHVGVVSAALLQKVTFYARGRKYSTRNIITIQKGPELPPGERKVWDCTENGDSPGLRIPSSTPPTNLGGCRIMDVGYMLKIKVKLPFPWAGSISGTIEIVIGTIPFESRNSTEESEGQEDLQPQRHVARTQRQRPLNAPDISHYRQPSNVPHSTVSSRVHSLHAPPPSYEEVVCSESISHYPTLQGDSSRSCDNRMDSAAALPANSYFSTNLNYLDHRTLTKPLLLQTDV